MTLSAGPSAMTPNRLRIAPASAQDRRTIFRMRHAVYAGELRQHAERPDGLLTDALDGHNHYLVAARGDRMVGFISITPPSAPSYSIDKYLSRETLPFPLNGDVYEARLLTVEPAHRGVAAAGMLMYAALRWVEARGGMRIIAMGRREVLPLYVKAGLRPLGHTIQAGEVTYELLAATCQEIRQRTGRYARGLNQLRRRIEWQLDEPFDGVEACYHGGAFWEGIGDRFDTLERRHGVINADVLDAWFPPAPGVLDALQRHLPWLVRTSPPTQGEGLLRAIADARGLDPRCLVTGGGSSSLIFLAFQRWLRPSSRVLLPDPTYAEYAHVLERVVGCRVDRWTLSPHEGYRLDLDRFLDRCRAGYDWVVLVNPNSPTGLVADRGELAAMLRMVPERTRVWIDETYIEYAGAQASLEPFAMRTRNVIVCKSMSKVYALSGARVAYLCAPAPLAAELRRLSPPWAVGSLAQVAGVAALEDPVYYTARYRETHVFRKELAGMFRTRLGVETIPGVANFLLCEFPPNGPDASAICTAARNRGLFLRNASLMSDQLGRFAVRIAVKDRETNRRMIDILSRSLHGEPAGAGEASP